MEPITFEQQQLMSLYNPGSRAGLVAALTEMRGYLEPEETDLLALTDSTLARLAAMTDEEFSALDLVPEFAGQDAKSVL